VHAAGFKVLAAEKRGALKTHSLHGELVFMLGGIKHVSPANPKPQSEHVRGGGSRERWVRGGGRMGWRCVCVGGGSCKLVSPANYEP